MNLIRFWPKKIHQSTLFKNYVFLSIYQGINFLVPLIIIPYVIKIVGIERFGLIAFSYAFVNYFNVLTDYGFNLSATKNISVNRADKEKINKILTTVILSKLMFFFIAFILFSALLFIPFFRVNYLLHFAAFTLVFAQVLMPVWFFQGLENMKYLAIFNTISKILFVGFIFWLIKKPADYFLVNFLQGLSGIVAALICYAIIFKVFKNQFVSIKIKDIQHEIKDGWMLFLSSLAVNIYVNSNVFILGIFASPIIVGYYSIAEKVYLALKQFDMVFSQVIFPRVCILAKESAAALKNFYQKIFTPYVLFISLACIMVALFAKEISIYFLKNANSEVILLIRIFCIVPVINAFNTPPFQTLLALNEKKKYGVILISGCAFNVITNLILDNLYGDFGAMLSVMFTETFITIGLSFYFFKVLNYKISFIH